MNLAKKIRDTHAEVGVVGLGYVGLPLALTVAEAGYSVTGFDADEKKVEAINSGRSYISHIASESVRQAHKISQFSATSNFSRLGKMDVIIVCVPTPLTMQREPDMRFVTKTTNQIAAHLKPGHLVILESTTYPGTTATVVRPILERNGLKSGKHFFLAYSPEREDPGNSEFSTKHVPKVVGGDGDDALDLAVTFYQKLVTKVVPVSSVDTAEAVKLTENIFRAVNIAMVNELKVIYNAMGIDIWEVIEAAKTKPFGFMPFYPGPGLGGHCIPIDPFYLTWKAREYEVPTRFIELAGEINSTMPHYVVQKLSHGLNDRFGRGLKNARILVIGIAYKKNVDDTRGSASFKIMRLLRDRGAEVSYYDPYVPAISMNRDYPELAGMESIAWDSKLLSEFTATLILTDHDEIDYHELVGKVPLVVDTRNVTAKIVSCPENVLKA